MKRYRLTPGKPVALADFDPAETRLVRGGKDSAVKKSASILVRLNQQQELLYAGRQHKLLIVLQGMDTSGKDGTITHVMGGFNPQGVRVISYKRPSEVELDHDYLWRVHAQVPAKGEIVIFNRSQYEDVLVVRVHNLVPEAEWQRRYAQINEFERMLVENGTTILKFFLHISSDEQKKRLEKRVEDPTRRWKFQHGDLTERKLWPQYMEAYEAALETTTTKWAPWYVVPSISKWYRNYIIGSVVANTLEKMDMKYPEIDLSKEVIE